MVTDGSRPSLSPDTANAAMHRPGGPQGALVKERNVYSVSVGEIKEMVSLHKRIYDAVGCSRKQK